MGRRILKRKVDVSLDLTELARLQGAPDGNFEALTRAIVSRRFGSLGTIRERRQQPGVEFFVRVEHTGALGDPGRVWGWSCKWFLLGSANQLTREQRKQIVDSFEKAVEYVEGLTDFVLCLPQRPAQRDLDWIDSVRSESGVAIQLWAAENFDAELGGLDELRSTFFGELVLSPGSLAQVHERSIRPVRARWAPPNVHTENHVQQLLESALLRPQSFQWLNEHVDLMDARIGALRSVLVGIEDNETRKALEVVASDLGQFAVDLRSIAIAGRNRRPSEVRERVVDQQSPTTSPRKLLSVVRELRKRRVPEALSVTGLAADIRDAVAWLDEMRINLQAPMVAVVAAAGMGKTHLAAQLTVETNDLPAGVFIQGSRLRAGDSLDDLVRRIPGFRIQHFEDLLEAMNSAGGRAGARLPLIIDGLNEAERPSEWRSLLEELTPALSNYPNVLVITTLREVLAARAIPDGALTVNLEWYQAEVNEIVDAYFNYYLINVAGAWLPTWMFFNPLFIRMYCEAANPLRQEPVGAEALPNSLIGVFELYREGFVLRLADDPARVPVPADQIERRLRSVAFEMWTRNVRRLPTDEVRSIFDAGETNWDESVFRRLEEEGVIFREEVEGAEDTETGIVFDRFAGYLIADALLVQMSYDELDHRLGETSLWRSILGDECKALGEDTGVNLVGLLPRRFSGRHFWRYAPNSYRTWAVVQELGTESEFLDEGTVDELATLIVSWGAPRYGSRHPFDRLWEIRTSSAHRLNARFLDRVLRLLPLPERDRKWSEWIRLRADDFLRKELNESIEHWTVDLDRVEADDLNALAMSWLLTSTSVEVRDVATKALQRFGRPEPKRLFDVATHLLNIDDPYIVERMVGAAFGAASSHQMPDPGGSFERSLAVWLMELADCFLENGTMPTSHEILRNYIRVVFEFAGTLHPGSVPDNVDPFAPIFAALSPASLMADNDPNMKECASTLGIDFENYVIGSAFEDRGNYDYHHVRFREARGEVLARVWELGWRAELFGVIDQEIADAANRHGGDRAKVERYGKKYGWIAYYELIGRLDDSGHSRGPRDEGGRIVTLDIDPSFPEEPPAALMHLPEWAPSGPIDDEAWFRSGEVCVPNDMWSLDEIHGVSEDWVLVEGFLEHRREGRQVFGFFHTLLLEAGTVDAAVEIIDRHEYLGNEFFPSLLRANGIFAGEVPWSRRFDVSAEDVYDVDQPHCVLQHDRSDVGIKFSQVAVELMTVVGGSPTALKGSYDVPSFEFAALSRLRQLPGTLDLVDFDGVRASATFRAEKPWRGNLLFVRRDLIAGFARDRSVMQVAWGERGLTFERGSVPKWVNAIYESYEYVWHQIRVTNP